MAWDAEHACATVRVMGPVQIEVLARLLQDRFGLDARLLPPHVLYRETIAAPAVGCGHYEPLRHYAEAHLLLSPGPRGSGVTFDSRCHAVSYTHLDVYKRQTWSCATASTSARTA